MNQSSSECKGTVLGGFHRDYEKFFLQQILSSTIVQNSFSLFFPFMRNVVRVTLYHFFEKRTKNNQRRDERWNLLN